jgi:hypothetical protein
VRRLHAPTLAQWTCAHQWKTTTSRPGKSDVVRVRYLTCQHCGLKVKTEERLAVPWDEQDLMALVAHAFSENTVIDVEARKTQRIFNQDLSQLNAYLAPHGWQLELVWDQGQIVGGVRRRMPPDVQ